MRLTVWSEALYLSKYSFYSNLCLTENVSLSKLCLYTKFYVQGRSHYPSRGFEAPEHLAWVPVWLYISTDSFYSNLCLTKNVSLLNLSLYTKFYVQGRSQFPFRGLYAPDHLVCVIYHSKYSFYRNLSFTKNVCLAKLVWVCTPNFTSRGVASTPLKNLTPLK